MKVKKATYLDDVLLELFPRSPYDPRRHILADPFLDHQPLNADLGQVIAEHFQKRLPTAVFVYLEEFHIAVGTESRHFAQHVLIASASSLILVLADVIIVSAIDAEGSNFKVALIPF